MKIIDPAQFGISFSVKECRNYEIDPEEALQWLLHKAGWRRFRLMSYWNICEPKPGSYDFAALDAQFNAIEKAGGHITLCLGAKQPRWPEYHWPVWAWQLPTIERDEALLKFVETVVERYKDRRCLISYQLENEALLQGFGEKIDIDRQRLLAEYSLVKSLDPMHPVIMSTSNAWGIPLRRPIPDIVGFSYYLVMYSSKKRSYSRSRRKPWFHRVRARLIALTVRRPVYVHELQLEPWGPTANWKMTTQQQNDSMGADQIKTNISYAQAIHHNPIDLWGAEWWYWRFKQGDPSIWQAVRNAISKKNN